VTLAGAADVPRPLARAMAGTAATLGVAEIATQGASHSGWPGPTWLAVVLALVTAAPIAVAVDRPRLAMIAVTICACADVVAVAPHQASFGAFVCLLAAAFFTGHASGVRARPALGWVEGLCLSAVAVAALGFGEGPDATPAVLFALGAVALGHVIGTSRRRAVELTGLVTTLSRERELRAQEAVTAERNRISREVHDAVAHSISVIVVQAQAARTVLRHDPQSAETALRSIEDTGRRSVQDLRQTLEMLRRPEEEAAPGTLGLAGLDDLVRAVESTGAVINQHRRGLARPLPLPVDLTAYRVIQEALTNALKHGRPACIDLDIRYAPAQVVLRVRNRTSPSTGTLPLGKEMAQQGSATMSAPGPVDSGYGLLGLRERVAVLGGRLTAGPGAEHDWILEATLPTDPA
jgi:signal transduction histidine kinase